MKKILFLLLIATGALFSCEEVEEVGKYDNWQARNEAYIDSIKVATGTGFVATGEAADAMEIGKLYAIQTTASTSTGTQYVYCKKLVSNLVGERPMYKGWHSKVNTFYYGTLINGEKFDGNFVGYTALDKSIPTPPAKAPTEFDVTASFDVSGLITGWTAALQFMRMGERWMMYIPQESAYGSSDSGAVPAYSALVFDVVLDSFDE